MARPCKPRKTCCVPGAYYFKPRGIPLCELEETTLNIVEVESLRLADSLGLYHEAAAKKMGISRQTFGNTIKTARSKIADAIIKGKALRIEQPKRKEFK